MMEKKKNANKKKDGDRINKRNKLTSESAYHCKNICVEQIAFAKVEK
jgi:uncharacterized membrane protein